jgi:hypothetical protein
MPSLILRNRIDAGVFTTALRDSFALVRLWLAAFCIGLAGVLGWHYGAQHTPVPLAPMVTQHAELPHHPQQAIGGPLHPRRRP